MSVNCCALLWAPDPVVSANRTRLTPAYLAPTYLTNSAFCLASWACMASHAAYSIRDTGGRLPDAVETTVQTLFLLTSGQSHPFINPV